MNCFNPKTMYSRKHYLFAAALLLFAACQNDMVDTFDDGSNLLKENVQQQEQLKMQAPSITALLENESSTKTVLEVDGEGVGTIYWTPADEINVFYGSTSTHYVSQNVTNATTAVFSTSDVIGSTESESENIWGLYPYNSSATCTGSAVFTTLPETQYGVPGSFDDDLFITLAHNTSTMLRFKNVCGGIKFSLSRDDIASVTFQGNYGEEVAGDISIEDEIAGPSYTVVGGKGKGVITLMPKSGTTFLPDEWYYIILLPQIFSEGFTMTFTTLGGAVGTFNYTASAVLISRGSFGRKAYIDAYSTLPTPNNKIYYTTTDHNVVTPNVESVFKNGEDDLEVVSNVYTNGFGIITLSGDLTSMGSSFLGCSTLSSITLPGSLSRLAGSSFNSCRALSSVTLPNTLQSIGPQTFQGCESLSGLVIPEGVESFGTRAFYGCSSLSLIVLPENTTAIGANAFSGCSSLLSITIPSKVTTIGSNAFRNCSSLSSIIVLPIVPPGTTNNGRMFENTNGAPIYVPAGSVSTYKEAEYWIDYKDRIQAMP